MAELEVSCIKSSDGRNSNRASSIKSGVSSLNKLEPFKNTHLL